MQTPKTDNEQQDIQHAVEVLRRGGVILYPTETVWGIGCDATNDAAVARIYDLKQRDDHKALITLVDGIAMLERTVAGIPDVAYELIECSDRPITIVYDRATGVSPRLVGQDGTLAVRVTGHDFCRRLVRALRHPLVSTSANISGKPTPASFNDIDKQLIDGADYVCTSLRDISGTGTPSMVMRLSADGRFKIIRK